MKLLDVEPRGWAACVVAASGPSLTEAVAEHCRGQRVIAVNSAYQRVPFADVLYAGDRDWWEDIYSVNPTFEGEKWTAHEPKLNDKSAIAEQYGLNLVAGPRQIDAPGFSLDQGLIHYGNNSGFQAINLAILFGATEIRLVGFDMRVVDGQRHFHGDYPRPEMNLSKYEHFLPAFDAAARMLPPSIRIVNCTPGSALRCFPMGELDEVLA